MDGSVVCCRCGTEINKMTEGYANDWQAVDKKVEEEPEWVPEVDNYLAHWRCLPRKWKKQAKDIAELQAWAESASSHDN